MKIGVMVESFRLSFAEGVKKAAEIGAQGIQAYASTGDLNVDNMTDEKLKEALDIVKSSGLVFSAICGDFGHGFTDPEQNKIYIEKSKRVLDLAKKLECNIVTTHIGTVPQQECELKKIMRAACSELAIYADSLNSAFAVETGPETGAVLFDFLESLGANGVRVNFDPANLVMLVADNPASAAKTLGKYIVHTHAKDGVKKGDSYLELPLGEGDVNFDTYLPALKSTGFDGFLTIEREVGDTPEKDVKMAVDFLKEKIVKYSL